MKAKEKAEELKALSRENQYKAICQLFQSEVARIIETRTHNGAPSISLKGAVIMEVQRWWQKLVDELQIPKTLQGLFFIFLSMREFLRHGIYGSQICEREMRKVLKSTGWEEIIPESPLTVERINKSISKIRMIAPPLIQVIKEKRAEQVLRPQGCSE